MKPMKTTLLLIIAALLLPACSPQVEKTRDFAWEGTHYPGNHLFSSRPDISYY